MHSRQKQQQMQRIVCSRLSEYVWHYWQVGAKGVGSGVGGGRVGGESRSKRQVGTRPGWGVGSL